MSSKREQAIKWLEAEIIKVRDTSDHLQSQIAELNSDLSATDTELCALEESRTALKGGGNE